MSLGSLSSQERSSTLALGGECCCPAVWFLVGFGPSPSWVEAGLLSAVPVSAPSLYAVSFSMTFSRQLLIFVPAAVISGGVAPGRSNGVSFLRRSAFCLWEEQRSLSLYAGWGLYSSRVGTVSLIGGAIEFLSLQGGAVVPLSVSWLVTLFLKSGECLPHGWSLSP